MMITIYGLAPKTKYQDVKLLIKQQCNIEEFILDNLVVDTDGSKKVRIGLADDSEGYKLMKCLNGYRMPGNFILKLLPVGKTPTNPNVATQGTYDSRPGYQNQPQNDYTIQQRTDYMGSNDFNPSPRGASGLTVQIRCPRPYAPSIQPQGSMDSMRPWTPGGHSNQWGANQPSVALQVPQNTYYGPGTNHASPGFTHQQPGPRPEIQHFEQNRQVLRPEQGYTGYSPKNNIPITIMKENFQGPSQYNINSPAGQYPQHTPPSSWQQQGHQVTQPKPQFSKSGVYDKPYDDRKYQSDQPRDPKAVQPKPDTYKEYEKRRGFSPPERREEPVVRRVSPARRDERAPAKVQPPLRRVSPQRNDRRYSPTGKKSSPAADRHHHNVRHETSHKGPSPTRRLASPVRRDDRPVPRYSPPRHHDKTADKYAPDKDVKKVRPAYDPPAQASNQAMYSGGYRPSHHDNVTLTASAKRQEHPTQHPKQHPPSWQRHRDEPPVPKQDVERRDSRLQIARERLTEHTEKPFSPARKSRSPHRQNRSPNRDRYKKNSPSPRSSYSPRRSWALEKRRSPDAPPPPVWPGQNEDRNRSARPSIPEKDDKPKHQPVWEPRSFKEEEQRHRRPDERQFEEAKMRIAKDLMERPPQQAADTNRFQREPKFSPRRDECDRDNYRRRETPDRKVRREDFDISRRARDEDRPDNYDRRRLQSPRHESRGNSVKEVDKDFGDVYNRAVPFRKKVDELRKSPSKKREDFDDDRRHDERDRNREEIRHRYEEHMRYREEESRRLRERDERPEDRTDRLREDRVHRDEDRRDDYRTREDMERERDRAKIIDDNKPKRIFYSNTVIKQKRDKAIEEISEKIMNRNEDYKHVQGEQRQRIFEELKLSVARIVYDMFGETDVSFIEIIVKYQARYTLKDEEQILQNVMLSLPKQFRTIKRHASDVSDIPAKTSRLDPNAELNTGNRIFKARVRQPINLRTDKKPFKQIARSVKPEQPTVQEQRTNKSEIRMNKGLEKSVKSTGNSGHVVKETHKPAQEVQSSKIVTKEPDSCSRLNAIMTKMVDAEIRDIITKIKNVLPEVVPNYSECLVVDLLRDTAEGKLKNVLGLNLTKRLLNVYNPLYVKVQFNGKPEKNELREFLKKYNFTTFVRKAVNIFAAQVKTIDDFDRICSERDIKCGKVSVTVSPCYKFTRCPSNLKTNYMLSDDEDSQDGVGIDIKDNYSETSDKNNKPINKTPPKKENVPGTSAQNPIIKSPIKYNNEKTPVSSTKLTTAGSSKVSLARIHNTPAKVTPVKVTTAKNKPVKFTPTKVKKATRVENDYDELDDQDILALMSEGIVLDECSGSDME